MRRQLLPPVALALMAASCMTPAAPIAPGAGFAQLTLQFES